ncbi:kinase-like domain-containing protein [Xylaria sp. FL1042]|nr:kinase-like domain-containing protein [Xylaria sp. FL1042]
MHDLPDNYDNYIEPGSEPHSLNYKPLMRRLVPLKINYVLLRITGNTHRMAYEFGEIYKSVHAQVRLHKSTRYFAHSGASGNRGGIKSSVTATLQFEELELGTSFEALRHLVAVSITRSVTRSAGVLSNAVSWKSSVTRAVGSQRPCAAAKTHRDIAAVQEEEDENKESSLVPVEMKGQAKYWLDFVVTAALQPLSETGACISIEPFIDGDYVKYNSNSGYVNEDLSEDPCNQAAQAFSHFTFERSRGRFLVNDLQGVGNMLTDPAIQTRDPKRFKLCDTNVNSEGPKFFFATHQCNALCRKLQLKSTRQMLIEGPLKFREEWPGVRSRVYRSNKLCRRILRENSSGNDGARKSTQFPGYYWCISCFPQLTFPMYTRACAEASEERHEFQFSSFFYELQGRAKPLKCPEHADDDSTDSNVGSIGAGLWARLTNMKKPVSAR